jgi:hypothetical protein
MADPNVFDALRIPSDVLIALDNRTFHFALQPWHYVVRLTHVLSMGLFFGGIALFDFRLLGIKTKGQLNLFTEEIRPWLYATFAVTFVTGVMLFLYDPVHVGSHAYFAPKLILMFLGLANAVVFHRTPYAPMLDVQQRLPIAKFAGAISLILWFGVVVFASLNVEAAPKVLLR